jgi:hypothetical protein
MLHQIQKRFNVKSLCAALICAISVFMLSVCAFADEPGMIDAAMQTEIKTAFSNAASSIMPIIIGILGVGLGIFAIFKGIKLAKKMFGTVSNG